MDGYLTLKTAIPRAAADQVGYDMGVIGDTVRKWCREPGTDEDAATGRRSPLDRVCDLITSVYRVDKELGPPGARQIVGHIVAHLDDLETDSGQVRQPLSERELEEKLEEAERSIAAIKAELRARRRNKFQAIK